MIAQSAISPTKSEVVPNIAALDALRPSRERSLIRVLGNLSSGDWTPKDFFYDKTNALPVNPYRRATVVGTGRWVHLTSGESYTLVVQSISARDAIPFFSRTEGMLVHVQGSPPVVYRLEPGLISWTEVQVVTSAEWSQVSEIEQRNSLFQTLSTEAVPLTLTRLSDRVDYGFTRNSQAMDPFTGTAAASNYSRAIPISFGATIGSALLIERPGTNTTTTASPVRFTVTTVPIAGPFGVSVPSVTYTDTSDTNSHYVFYGDVTNPANAPVHFSLLFKPNNTTNTIYQLRLGPSSDTSLSVAMMATLDGADLSPVTTFTTTGPMTLHDGGFVRLQNGWYNGYLTITMSNIVGARAYLVPANFLAYAGNTSIPALFTAGYTFSSIVESNNTPIYSLTRTNLSVIPSKELDDYRFSIRTPVKSADGSLILWMRNGASQPLNSTLVETEGLRVNMTRTGVSVTISDQSTGLALTSSAPALAPYGDRLLSLSWSTNSLKVYIDGGLIGESTTPVGALAFGTTGTFGRSLAGTNIWNGHIGAAYLGRLLSDAETAMLPSVVGPTANLTTFQSLADRTGTEGANPALPLSEVVWSPRFLGDGNYPYDAVAKARQLHATASLWAYFATNNSLIATLKDATPIIGAAMVPSDVSQDPSALMIDILTGESMKAWWYVWPAQWYGCANRQAYKNGVVAKINAYYALGIRHIQHDDPEINYSLALPFVSYRYGTGNATGTVAPSARGCNCPDCQARAIATGYGTLTTNNSRAFHTQTTIDYWSWIGSAVRSNSNMKISANLSDISAIRNRGYEEGRFHYPMYEITGSGTYSDAMIASWDLFRGEVLNTYAVNTQSSYEQVFGAADRTRRWMAACYAIGFLPLLPWDVYAGDSVIRIFGARSDISDITGFVRAQANLLRGYSLSSAVGETRSIPAKTTLAAWPSTNQVLVTVRYRASDGKRVIHAVDMRDTPAPFTLSWWSPIVGGASATVHRPVAYNSALQDAAVASGQFYALSTNSEAVVTITNSVASVAMDAGLWRIIDIQP